VKITVWLEVPTAGTVEGVAQAKVPVGVPLPPLRLDEAKVCPSTISEDVGQELMDGVPWPTSIITVAVVLPPLLEAVTV